MTANDLGFLEKVLKEQRDEIDRQIEAVRAQKEEDRQISLIGLYHRMDSLIKTATSSFSDISMGEVIECRDESVAEEYSRTIDIEISGRYREIGGDSVYCADLPYLTHRAFDNPTIVVSYLIPYDLVEDDPFFRENEK